MYGCEVELWEDTTIELEVLMDIDNDWMLGFWAWFTADDPNEVATFSSPLLAIQNLGPTQ